jgi:uncharacterized membrane protein
LGIEDGKAGSVSIEQHVDAPADNVAAYIGDFRNAKEWMVGVETVERLEEDVFRLRLESPIGKIEPEAKIVEHNPESIRWIYTSTIEGGGRVAVRPDENGGSIVTYTGDFRLKGRVLGRIAQAAGMEKFARMNGERSLTRLKHLMEARRY